MVDLRRPVEYNSVLAFKKSLCQFPEINHFLWERCVGEGYLIHYSGRSGRKHWDSFKERVMVGQRLKGWWRVDLGDGQGEGRQKPRPAAGEQVLWISLCLPQKTDTSLDLYDRRNRKQGMALWQREMLRVEHGLMRQCRKCRQQKASVATARGIKKGWNPES